MERENTPRIDFEELLKKAEPLIKTAVGAIAMGRAIQSKLESLIFEEQLLARYDRLTGMGLTKEQAIATLTQTLDNIVAKRRRANQEGENHE